MGACIRPPPLHFYKGGREGAQFIHVHTQQNQYICTVIHRNMYIHVCVPYVHLCFVHTCYHLMYSGACPKLPLPMPTVLCIRLCKVCVGSSGSLC